MITRVLPFSEWNRLSNTALGEVWGQMSPESYVVLVVESDSGEILGCWALGAVYHLEGLWLAPAERKKGSVLRRLFTAMRARIAETGVSAVVTSSASDEITEMIRRSGGQQMPDSFVLPMAR